MATLNEPQIWKNNSKNENHYEKSRTQYMDFTEIWTSLKKQQQWSGKENGIANNQNIKSKNRKDTLKRH